LMLPSAVLTHLKAGVRAAFDLRRRRFFGQWDKLRADRSKEV
jgi:hypothetical protein